MVKDENYISIQGWMLNLGIKGNALIAFACIYGFSQDGESEFTGSAQYIADWCGISRTAAFSVLKSLVQKKLVIKSDLISNGVKLCNYKYSPEGVQETYQGIKKLNKGAQETCPGGVQETCHHNISSNNKENIGIPTPKQKREDERFLIFYQNYPRKVGKKKAREKFNKVIKEGETLDSILSKLKVYEKQLERDKTEEKYIKHPASFLGCLEDFEDVFPEKQEEKKILHCSKCGVQLVNYICPSCFTNHDTEGNAI